MNLTARVRSVRIRSAAAIVFAVVLTASVDSSVGLASPPTASAHAKMAAVQRGRARSARSSHACREAARRNRCRSARQARERTARRYNGVEASIAASESTPACNLYAANSGSDENDGSISAPFRSLRKLATSLSAGEVGCLQSGETFDSGGNVDLEEGQTHGQEDKPITITSTEPSDPATITHSFELEHGVNFVVLTHLDFSWSLPKPWSCWNAEGDVVPGRVISGPDACASGSHYSEAAVQIALGGKDDSLTYDEITSNDTNICLLLDGAGNSWGENNVLEHDRIHDCGPTVESASTGFPVVNEEWGWHSHGVYDYARHTVIRNNYIYDNSRDGVLLYGGGEGAIVEHNIIDHNGAGVWFGNDKNDRVAWNIVTNSTSPRGVADYGIGSNGSGSGNVATDNCLDHNLSGEVEGGGFTATENKLGANPAYVNAEQHDYTLLPSSACLGYGPDTAQPSLEEPVKTAPPEETVKTTPPVETTAPVETVPPTETTSPTNGSTGSGALPPSAPGGGARFFPPHGPSGTAKRKGGMPGTRLGGGGATHARGHEARANVRRHHRDAGRHRRR